MEDPVVVLAASPRGWAAGLRAHAADHGGVVVRATVLTPEDALDEQCAVVLVDDVTSFLKADLVAALQRRGRAVLGLYDPTDSQGKSDLVDAGVDQVAPADIAPADLVEQIVRLAARRPEDRPAPRPAPARDPVATTGRVIGVTGPGGGVGVTEVAIEVAAAQATGGLPTALVDADELAPSHAARLGLALHPNLVTAVRAVDRAGDPGEHLQALATRRPLHALTGAAVPDDWGCLSREGVVTLLHGLAAAHGCVVVDLGHCPPPADGPTGLRFGHGRLLARRCHDVVVVTAPTPVAVTRTMGLVADLDVPPGRLHLVLNRVGGDRWVREECVDELRRATGVQQVHVLADDPKVARAAWQGSRVPRGRFVDGVAALVDRAGWR